MVGGVAHRAGSAAAGAFRGELPRRYQTDLWDLRFRQSLDSLLNPGMDILDVGGGARPTLGAHERPASSTYWGLDRMEEELGKAPAGSYDKSIVADITERHPGLESRFDLAVSWLVLEHVHSMDAALNNVRAYLRPGGSLVAQIPGAFSAFALVNRVVPHRLAVNVIGRIQGRSPDSVFPAYYDRCWYSALSRSLGQGWSEVQIHPLYTGAPYFKFSKTAQAAYLCYEELIHSFAVRNLAPYYLVIARAD